MSIFVAAHTLGEESGWSLTPLEYQKILYIGQMMHLDREARPLFDERFEAWDFGPVVPVLWRALGKFGRTRVTEIAGYAGVGLGVAGTLAVTDAYCLAQHMRPGQLINFTHRAGGAWETFYETLGDNVEIPVSAMLAEWRDFSKPSNEAVEWATRLVDDIEAGASEYLADADQRAFRARLFDENRI